MPGLCRSRCFFRGLAAFELGEHERAEARLLEAREAADAGGEAVEHAGSAVDSGQHRRSEGRPRSSAAAL